MSKIVVRSGRIYASLNRVLLDVSKLSSQSGNSLRVFWTFDQMNNSCSSNQSFRSARCRALKHVPSMIVISICSSPKHLSRTEIDQLLLSHMFTCQLLIVLSLKSCSPPDMRLESRQVACNQRPLVKSSRFFGLNWRYMTE